MLQAFNPRRGRVFTRRLSGYFTVLAALLFTSLAPRANAAAGCNVVYTITPQNSSAFGAAITIQNTGTTAWSNWTLTWAFANGQTITSLWNGSETQSGANVTVASESYNGSVAAGGSVTGVGFNGTWNGSTNAVPTSFAVNGITCGAATTGSFTLSPSAATLSVAQGASATDTITVTDVSPFTGAVTLAASGLPSGVTATFGTNPATKTSLVTITASATATAGTSTVTITGTSGALTAKTTIALTITSKPGFTLKLSIATLTVVPGSTATDAITITDIGGFTGAVTLVASGLPTGMTASFSPSSTTGTSVLTLAYNPASCNVATATITITGISGTLTATTTIALTVAVPASGFTITPAETTLSIVQSGSATDTITVTEPACGFTGAVTLSASGLPAGVTATFGTNPTTGTSVLTFTASSTATIGAATVAITGTSGSLTETTTITLTVTAKSGFTVTPSASALTVAQGSSATDTLTVTDIGTFTGSVTCSASGIPSGLSVSFGTNPFASSSILTFTTGSSVPPGSYPITITCTSGTITWSFTIIIKINASSPGSFILGASPSAISVVQGSSATDTITITDVSGFSGSVTLAATSLPTGVTAAFATNPTTGTSLLTLTASSAATAGTSNITITGTSGSITASETIPVTVQPASSGFACGIVYSVSAQSSTGFGGAFTISNTGTTAWTSWTLTWTFPSGQTISSFWNGVESQSGANVTVLSESYNSAVPAGGTVTNVGFDGVWNGVSNKTPASFSINGTPCTLSSGSSGSFTLASAPSTLSVTQGGNANASLTVTDVGTSVGSVSLSAAGLPSGVTASFATNPTFNTSVVTFTASSSATAGPATVTITGTNGSGTVTATATIALTVKLPQPIISWVSPTSGIVGTSINIMPGGALGAAPFGATQGSSAVYFGSTPATVTSWAVNGVQVTVPSVAAGVQNVTVVVNGQTSNAVPFTVTSTAPATPTNNGNSTWFSALGTPYGGCGVPQQYLDSQYFVALNVQNDPANYTLFLSRPISSQFASDIGLWENGTNCGRWVHITIGDYCAGTNDGEQDEPFCRGGTGWVSDQFTGAQLDLVVADSCQDGNAWCRDDPYHLDQAEGALNQYVLNGAAVGDMNPTYWNNRQISWNFELPPNYTGDIGIGMLQSSTSAWTAISIVHLPNGIHGLQYLSNGVWTRAINDGDLGEDFLISPTVPGGANYEVQVYDITNTLINNGRIYSFTYPTAACGTMCTAAYTPLTYTTSQ